MNDIRSEIKDVLVNFNGSRLKTSAIDFLNSLGLDSDRRIDLPENSPEMFVQLLEDQSGIELSREKLLIDQWKQAELLFQITDEELKTRSVFKDTNIKPGFLQSYLFFAVSLKDNSYARGKLAQITRQINRAFPMPVMVLFHYDNKLSIAIINRRIHKLDSDKDVLGKVSLIHDIDLLNPHRGHLDIFQDFLEKSEKIKSFDDLHRVWGEVLNIELLNKRFYERIADWYLYAVKHIHQPDKRIPEKDDELKHNSVIRLLTRLIFIWFAKEKQLIPLELFDEKAIKQHLKEFNPEDSKEGRFYKAYLQNLFFPTLNVKQDDRKYRDEKRGYKGHNDDYMDHTRFRHRELFKNEESIPQLFKDIPFLNGGLFECLDYKDENKNEIRVDGFSDVKSKQLWIPDALFFNEGLEADLSEAYGGKKSKKNTTIDGLIKILNDYKFTITENTPIEEEVALDPELLGRIFENLLAQYNPETQKSARKDTGSFYTPREIVNYMIDISLKEQLSKILVENNPNISKADAEAKLDQLFEFSEKEPDLTNDEKSLLAKSIYDLKIIDPACGSGAFPMGLLQKLVFVLNKLDKGHDIWKDSVLRKTPAGIRNKTREMLEEQETDYLWKIGLIQNCIYGIDIQPIAVQIAKLRCFISLLVDFKINPEKENLGVHPLPNLDFKFVAADTLVSVPEEYEESDDPKDKTQFGMALATDFFTDLEDQTASLFFAQEVEEKKQIKRNIESLINREIEQNKKELDQLSDRVTVSSPRKRKEITERMERKIQLWESYRNIFVRSDDYVQFFSTKYFFPEVENNPVPGKNGFDIVIGNPPYVQIQKRKDNQADWKNEKYLTYNSLGDMYCLFYEKGVRILKEKGSLCYITQNKWMRAGYGVNLREYLSQKVNTKSVFDFGMTQHFDSGTTYTCILHIENTLPSGSINACYASNSKELKNGISDYFEINCVPKKDLDSSPWVILPKDRTRIKVLVEAQGLPLENRDWNLNINRGVLTGLNEAFYISQKDRDKLIKKEPQAEKILVPLLRGRFVDRYSTKWDEDKTWMINSHNGIKEKKLEPINIEEGYPEIYKHLQRWEKKLKRRQDKGNEWWNLRNCAYLEDFSKPKIIYPNMTKWLPFYFDKTDHFFVNDKAFILSGDESVLPYLISVFNSSLYRCCFKDNFPDLLGNTYELRKIFFDKIPIKKPTDSEAQLFDILVDYVQFVKSENVSTLNNSNIASIIASFLEDLIDACVMEVYFHDHMKERELDVIDLVRDLLIPFPNDDNKEENYQVIQNFYNTVSKNDHPIHQRINNLSTQSPDLMGIILKEGKV